MAWMAGQQQSLAAQYLKAAGDVFANAQLVCQGGAFFGLEILGDVYEVCLVPGCKDCSWPFSAEANITQPQRTPVEGLLWIQRG